MKKSKKLLVSLVIGFMLVLSAPIMRSVGLEVPRVADLFSQEVSAVSYNGTCGENLTWALDTETGLLEISGTGAMKDYGYNYGSTPWYSYRYQIKKITIAGGVTSIGNFAFCGCYLFTSITIPDSVTSIGIYAFESCRSITSITIPDSVTSIGSYAFYDCSSLTSITIPDSVTSIEEYAFSNCENLSVVFYRGSKFEWEKIKKSPKENIMLTDAYKVYNFKNQIDNELYECYEMNDGNVAVYKYKGDQINLTIPNIIDSKNVSRICSKTFYHNTNLVNLIIPNNITEIEDYAFSGCTRLKKITFQEGLKFIGNFAFYDCSSLTDIIIPNSITEIGDCAFRGCIRIKKITLQEGLKLIGNFAFYDCSSLSNLIFPKSLETIGGAAFGNCTYLRNIEFQEGLKIIGDYAFCYCNLLSSIKIPNSVYSLGTGAFVYCSELNDVTLSTNITNIDLSTFYGCDNLPKYEHGVYAGDCLISVENVNLFEVKDGTRIIAKGVFDEKSDLECVVIPESLKFINEKAFEDCLNLKDIYYKGTESQWAEIDIADNNFGIYGAEIHYNDFVLNEVEPTCIKTGIRQFSCSCGNSYEITVPMISHNIVDFERVEPTCTVNGYTAGTYCDMCNRWFSGHDVINKTGHRTLNDPAIAPTCTKTGLTQGSHCSVCGEVLVAQSEIALLPHTLATKQENIASATCTEEGSYEAVTFCNVCKTELSREKKVIEKAPHVLVIETEVAPTCTKTGLTEGSHCSVCGEVINKQAVVAKLPHTYKTTTTKADLKKDGSVVTKCSVCGDVSKNTKIPYPKTITLSATKYTYTGKAITPTVTVKGSDGKVVSSSNYTVKYTNNTNPGTATVTVTFKGNYTGTKTLKFTLVLKQVTGLKASKVTTTSVALSWAKVPGAKYYKVERSADGKKWTTVITTTSATYTISKLKAGAKYQFRVTALDSTKKLAGKTSAVFKTGTLTSAPSITLKSTKSKTATATWKKVTGASSYIVYKSTDGKKWTKVATTTGTSYNLTKLTAGKKVYVKVYAVNGYKHNSAASKTVSVTVKK